MAKISFHIHFKIEVQFIIFFVVRQCYTGM